MGWYFAAGIAFLYEFLGIAAVGLIAFRIVQIIRGKNKNSSDIKSKNKEFYR